MDGATFMTGGSMPSSVLKGESRKTDQTIATTFRAPRELVEEIDRAAADEGLTRNKAIVQLLRFALSAHWKEHGDGGSGR
ncbi:MAG: ribbon-helix-helix protein, CopG family [Myxococcaceae bacterium]